ncbi:MAG: hypothetical protein LWX23_02745 [Spirochaetia bacterium]|jgi:hypothetical protein|uniref:Uncharacterized protein n=2 Tax=root TaxID=1 RepID=A0A652ZZ51_9SPIR|nr:hypothetical protein [Spirochaetia bacterium]MDD3820256.1 hypothetical protein [Spirochaetales bacterium]NLX45214.1 hypothetical protein [Treponema sp.]VBB41033.1 hypothetical protein TRIP_E50065 [uncultured Spirochaetota bacterium]HAP55596.1 hypothetical protein [Spirochaetaceae bacterium]
MRIEQLDAGARFYPGPRRYRASPFRESKAGAFLGAPASVKSGTLGQAIRELSAEDEEIPLPDEHGPIVFKDGVFQIDVSESEGQAGIDPALKGLIDSILGSQSNKDDA